MRTTVEIPDDLLKRAKLVALERNSTLRQLITLALEKELTEAAGQAGQRAQFPVIHVSPDCPAIHLSVDELKAIEAEQESLAK